MTPGSEPDPPEAGLAALAHRFGLRHVFVCFTDLLGVQRAKLVPVSVLDEVASHGLRFAGFTVWLDLDPADPDVVAVPDPATLVRLPWRPEVGWVAADLHLDGEALRQDPRGSLKRLVAAAAGRGFEVRSGVECEFYLTAPDGRSVGDPADRQTRSAYDLAALSRRYDVIAEMIDAIDQLGWRARQGEHEDAHGQFEITWTHADALATADRHVFFRYMARTIAEKHGLRATFMPKPFTDAAGSGCHAHVSLWKGETNLFLAAEGEMLRRHAIGGVVHSADALMAFWNPTVNSYKRVNAPAPASSTIGYAANNRTQLIRLPDDAARFELRLPDGAANPYLLQAGIVAACIDGLDNRRDPGAPAAANGRDTAAASGRKLPLNLLDALRALQASPIVGEKLGDVVPSFLRLKVEEWKSYCRHLTEWEMENSLDC